MNKRQRKKAFDKYVCGKQRSGCEYCYGVCNPIMKTDEGWVNLSINLSKHAHKNWRMYLKEKDTETGESERIAYVNAYYCFNCGRKLK